MTAWRRRSRVVDDGGSELRISVAERSGAGTPILYLHGFGSTGEDFDGAAVVPEWSGRRLLAPDLPGFGASPAPDDAERWSVERMVDLVVRFIEVEAAAPVTLVGHSMGGLVGLLACRRAPRSMRAFVNVEGNLAPIDCRVLSRAVAERSEREGPRETLAWLAETMAASGAPGYDRFARDLDSRVDPVVVSPVCRSIVRLSDGAPLLRWFVDLGVPRALLHGSENGDLPYVPDLAASGVPVSSVEGADHFPAFSHPEAFYRTLVDILQTLEA